ncbi:hypothetical protein FJW06_20770 [Mesorhizobium sp. B4-1-3]|uniref:hypothetical protein n=1 Tax=Mesorhizobium sp. B4-1-3 TaxID=2589889 RepID=UPI001129CE98|nr:hypothetical protein [Mesorhizobium sp. B4-1-3]TPI11158.1 hypothetical protein FJW06_20770 [Mesorhizobium sp. B4-1-3]
MLFADRIERNTSRVVRDTVAEEPRVCVEGSKLLVDRIGRRARGRHHGQEDVAAFLCFSIAALDDLVEPRRSGGLWSRRKRHIEGRHAVFFREREEAVGEVASRELRPLNGARPTPPERIDAASFIVEGETIVINEAGLSDFRAYRSAITGRRTISISSRSTFCT